MTHCVCCKVSRPDFCFVRQRDRVFRDESVLFTGTRKECHLWLQQKRLS